MSTHASKIWFVSLDNLLHDGGATLRRADSPILDTDECIAPHSPFTISLESFCIFNQYDRKKKGNDLLVRSWTTYGYDPPVEIVHFFEKNVALGAANDNLAVEHMFASDSYKNQSIELDIQILDVDGNDSLANDIRIAAHLMGAVFPVILPFTSIASSLYSNLKHVFSNPHDVAFSGTLKLYDKELSQQAKQLIPLRCGAYILFNQETEGDRYTLRELKVEPLASDSPGFDQILDDYVVIKIIPKVINSLNSEDLLTNQKLAASLLKKTDEAFDLPPNVLAKSSKLVNSFMLLKNAAKKAKLIDQLVEYKKLQQLRAIASHERSSRKDVLDQEERLIYLAQLIRNELKEKK